MTRVFGIWLTAAAHLSGCSLVSGYSPVRQLNGAMYYSSSARQKRAGCRSALMPSESSSPAGSYHARLWP